MMMLLRHIHLRMFSYELHILVKSLDACHIGLCVICEFHLVSSADALGAPIKVTHIYRASNLAGDCMEAGLPSLHSFAGALWSKCKMYDIFALHLLDYAQCYVAASLSVHRDASELSEKPSERSPEHLSLDHAVWLSAYRCIIKV